MRGDDCNDSRLTLGSPAPPGAGWQPVLTDALRERAIAAVTDIRRALATPREAAVPGDALPQVGSLASGSAGIALLYAYASRTPGLPQIADATADGADPGADGADPAADDARVEAHMDRAFRAAAEMPMVEGLFSGFTGIAWTAAHLWDDDDDGAEPREPGDAAAEDDAADDEVGEVVAQLVAGAPWRGDYDLVSGLVGLGVYALERVPRPTAVAALSSLLARLSELAERDADGLTWFTPGHLVPPTQRDGHPDGYYNLGLAHGIPGVIALLAGLCGRGVPDAVAGRARAMLGEATAWLLAHRLPAGAAGAYPWAWAPGDDPRPARSAWCYGDPGVAAALSLAARALAPAGAGSPASGDAAHAREVADAARAIALAAARRDPATSGVSDVGLCHGSAGLAHIFNRLYHATGEPDILAAARRWYAWTLDRLDRERAPETAGVLALSPHADGKLRLRPERGYLTGAAGVGLALLAAIADVEPAWDRPLLLSARFPLPPLP